MYQVDDTIAAVASAPGGALRGLVRISGPQALEVAAHGFYSVDGRELTKIRSQQRVAGTLKLGGALGKLPCVACVWPTERSYTRQPTVELHTLGSPPILEAAVQSLCAAGARLAQPGEFTMRAFLAGRLDLTQAEAVLGVIDATSQHDLDIALSQLAGGLAAPLHEVRAQLIDTLAHLEAGLDFAEEDIEFIEQDALVQGICQAAHVIASVQQQLQTRAEVDSVPGIVLVGSPNVGKSSLLNALVADAAAIVSPLSGTTRDYVARRTSVGDRDVLLIDTAGVEPIEEASGIPALAQAMTQGTQRQAALVLFCVDATRPLSEWETNQLSGDSSVPRLVVMTKSDAGCRSQPHPAAIATSSVTGQGLDQLRQAICDCLADHSRHAVTSTALRCHESLRAASASLQQARLAVQEGLGDELVAAELRIALEAVGLVVGAVYTDDILDRIFSRFCIGK